MRALGASAAIVVALGGCGTPSEPHRAAERAPIAMPAPYRARGTTMADRNRECERCHADVATEWRSSPHQQAELDPVYRRAFELEPLPFCQGCHAPEADPKAPVPTELAELGVGCVSCHLEGDEVLASPTNRETRAPHRVRRDERFASAGACAGCHEFRFPDGAVRERAELMQSTVTEHRMSAFADMSCAGCHMPIVSGRRSHDFSNHASEAALRDAIHVSAERNGNRLRLRLEARGVGHAYPTGDLFRRLEVSAEAIGPDYSSAGRDARYLTRQFDPGVHSNGAPRRVRGDTRLGATGNAVSELDLDLGSDVTKYPWAWRVAYQRVEHPVTTGDEHAVLSRDVTIGEGKAGPD